MLGVQPALGRTFLPEEDQTPGKYPVMLISYSLWQSERLPATQQLSASRLSLAVIASRSSALLRSHSPASISGFRPDVYLPMMMAATVSPEGNDNLTHRDYRGCTLLGRLKPGITIAQAQSEMNVIMSSLQRDYPNTNKDTAAIVRSERSRRVSKMAQQHQASFFWASWYWC